MNQLQSHPILADSFRTAGTSAMSGQLDDDDALTEPLLQQEGGDAGSVSKPPAARQVRLCVVGRAFSDLACCFTVGVCPPPR